MPELSPNECSIAGADARRRKTAATQARRAQSFALTSEPAVTPIPVGSPRRALLGDSRGVASSPFGVALDLVTAEQDDAV